MITTSIIDFVGGEPPKESSHSDDFLIIVDNFLKISNNVFLRIPGGGSPLGSIFFFMGYFLDSHAAMIGRMMMLIMMTMMMVKNSCRK